MRSRKRPENFTQSINKENTTQEYTNHLLLSIKLGAEIIESLGQTINGTLGALQVNDVALRPLCGDPQVCTVIFSQL